MEDCQTSVHRIPSSILRQMQRPPSISMATPGGLVGGEIERGVSNVPGRGESEVKSITRLTLPQALAGPFLGFGEAGPDDSRHVETERVGNVPRRDGENPGNFSPPVRASVLLSPNHHHPRDECAPVGTMRSSSMGKKRTGAGLGSMQPKGFPSDGSAL